MEVTNLVQAYNNLVVKMRSWETALGGAKDAKAAEVARAIKAYRESEYSDGARKFEKMIKDMAGYVEKIDKQSGEIDGSVKALGGMIESASDAVGNTSNIAH